MTKRSWRGWPLSESLCVRFPAVHQCGALASAGAATYRTRAHKYDNLRAAVVRILVGGARTLTPRFAALASHYLLEACFCRPGEGHDKGGVEARGKAVRQQALVPIPVGPTLAGINETLLAQMDARRDTPRDATGQTIGVLFTEEQRQCRPAPTPFAPEATTLATVTPRALIRLEGAVYPHPKRAGVASSPWERWSLALESVKGNAVAHAAHRDRATWRGTLVGPHAPDRPRCPGRGSESRQGIHPRIAAEDPSVRADGHQARAPGRLGPSKLRTPHVRRLAPAVQRRACPSASAPTVAPRAAAAA
jgi:hypothetical protein